MTPIPPAVRGVLAGLARMKRCALAPVQDIYEECEGRVEWHHVWTYGGRQIQEVWAIVAGCVKHHQMVQSDPAVRMAFEAASLKEATDVNLMEYPRKPWARIKRSLGIAP